MRDPTSPTGGQSAENTSFSEYLTKYYGLRDWATEEEARAYIRRRIEENNAAYPFLKAEDPDAVKALLFTRAKGGRVKLRQPKPKSTGIAPLGETAQPDDRQSPAVDFSATDCADDGSPDSIFETFGRGRGVMYRAWVPVSLLPAPRGHGIADGYVDDDGDYDWTELRRRGSPPAPKILVGPRGKVLIADGNHRIAWWRTQGVDMVPAWVIDERKGIADQVDWVVRRDEGAEKIAAARRALAQVDRAEAVRIKAGTPG